MFRELYRVVLQLIVAEIGGGGYILVVRTGIGSKTDTDLGMFEVVAHHLLVEEHLYR